MKLFIVTGSSRGFGHCIAKLLASSKQKAHILLCSRTIAAMQEFKSSFETADCQIHTTFVDFASPDVGKQIDQMLEKAEHRYTDAYLFNNAGSLGRLCSIESLTAAEIQSTLQSNLSSMMLLTSAFLRLECPRKFIVNVSSLAAYTRLTRVKPFEHWALYCSIKAARDMFHRVIVEEAPQSKDERRRVLNYAPGPLDTLMQAEIRDCMLAGNVRDSFLKMKEDGILVDPMVSAKVLIGLLEADTFENGSHVDYYEVSG